MAANVTSGGSTVQLRRRLPIGSELDGSVASFRLWAPKARHVEVVFDDGRVEPLVAEADGYFAVTVRDVAAGMTYRFRLDGDAIVPDPASRFQPEGPHGPSQLVDPSAFGWTDADFHGVPKHGQVLYELHIGTFTQAGTWPAAERELPALADLGITCVEVMPVNDFAGRWGWGYDGVGQFAPFAPYGTPDQMRSFVNAAHALSIGVILDVVYNHFGPDGNYLPSFSDDYFSRKHDTDWGTALNFDGPSCGPVREFFVTNVKYWLAEFHLDGFRFDATQAILDDSERHILAEITDAARAAAGKKQIYLINENEPQDTKLVRPTEAGGYGMDALWNDDFHHAAKVALVGHNENYYRDYLGTPQEFISAAKYGYLFQGQRHHDHGRRRGTPALDVPASSFVQFIENHDQIANTARGRRMHEHTSPGELRALTALLLLSPQTPMLFQGQEYAAPGPFLYFSDQQPHIAKLICQGRAQEIANFPSGATREVQEHLPDPTSPSSFELSKLDHNDRLRRGHAEWYKLHRDLLRLRRAEPVFSRPHRRGDFDGAVLGERAFALRFFADDGEDRLLLVNLGRDLHLIPAPEPLLAPPAGKRWEMIFSTDLPRYGGSGTAAPETENEGWFVPGRATVVMRTLDASDHPIETRVAGKSSRQQARPKIQSDDIR